MQWAFFIQDLKLNALIPDNREGLVIYLKCTQIAMQISHPADIAKI